MLKLSKTCKVMAVAVRQYAHTIAALETEAASLAARRARLLAALAEIDKRAAALGDNGARHKALERDVDALAALAMSEAETAVQADSDYDYCGQETIAERCRAMAIDALRDIGAYACAASLNRNTTVVR